MNKKSTIVIVIIAAISFLMHFQHFTRDLVSKHVWRQAQTQSTITNFYEEDMNILNPRKNERGNGDGIFRMEFPLMQWLIAASYFVFGNHLYITRLFVFLTGIFSIVGMYRLLKLVSGQEVMALIGSWAFAFSPAFYYYTICPIPDNLALACGIWGLAFFFCWRERGHAGWLMASGLLIALAALIKLPFILYYIVPGWYFISTWRSNGLAAGSVKLALATVAFALLPLAWYAAVVSTWEDNGIVGGVLTSTSSFATLTAYLLYHLSVTLPDLLLNYASVPFFIAAFYYFVKHGGNRHRYFPVLLACALALLGYLFFEINMIAYVHDYYLFPFYPLLFILTGYGAWRLYQAGGMLRYFTLALLPVMPLIAYLRINNRWAKDEPGFNNNLLVHKQALRAAVPDDALCIAGKDFSHYIFFYYINKKGWIFDHDNYSAAELKDAIRKGARYLYCDARHIDGNQSITPYLDKKMLVKGDIIVYRLKSAAALF